MVEMDLVVMISGWIAFFGLAVYVLSSGRISWNMFMTFMDELSSDKHILRRMWPIYKKKRDDLPQFLVGKIDDWFASKGIEFSVVKQKKKKEIEKETKS